MRFYAWTASGPGALLQESFVPEGDPGFAHGVLYPATLDITLPRPFIASGKHFVSVQLEFNGGGSWEGWISNHNAPLGQPAMMRDNAQGPDTPWSPIESVLGALNSDVTISLWGDDGNPPPPGSDPCGSWLALSTPSPAGTDHAILRDVVAAGPNDVWAVGEYTGVAQGSFNTFTMALHWDGSSWQVVEQFNSIIGPSAVALASPGPCDLITVGRQIVGGDLLNFSAPLVPAEIGQFTSFGDSPATTS